MKKTFLFTFGLIAVLASLFISCNDDSGENSSVVACNISATATDGGSVAIENYSGNTAVMLAGNTVKLIAIPNNGYEFVGWFIGDDEVPVSVDATYTFVVKKDVSLVARFSKNPVVSVSSGGYGSAAIKNYAESTVTLLKDSEVTVLAIPNNGYEFVGWFIGDDEVPVSVDVTYTFVVKKDIALVAKFKSNKEIAGHEYVDLGLPSGLKWATCNVDANVPEEFGCYYAWGEIEEKEDYSLETYKWYNSSKKMTKYCSSTYQGIIDNKFVLEPEDDVASVKWGGSWRMPTKDEIMELSENCTFEWISVNGVYGSKVTGPNGNSIFFPAAGCCDGAEVVNNTTGGFYWSSSTSNSKISSHVYMMILSESGFVSYSYPRNVGQNVRPVSE